LEAVIAKDAFEGILARLKRC
jgi:hypothetical protein